MLCVDGDVVVLCFLWRCCNVLRVRFPGIVVGCFFGDIAGKFRRWWLDTCHNILLVTWSALSYRTMSAYDWRLGTCVWVTLWFPTVRLANEVHFFYITAESYHGRGCSRNF